MPERGMEHDAKPVSFNFHQNFTGVHSCKNTNHPTRSFQIGLNMPRLAKWIGICTGTPGYTLIKIKIFFRDVSYPADERIPHIEFITGPKRQISSSGQTVIKGEILEFFDVPVVNPE